MLDLKEYSIWMKSLRIKKKDLAEFIGYRYDHVVQVLNQKLGLSGPFEKSLIMFKELYDNTCCTCKKPIQGKGYCSNDCAQVAFNNESKTE
jgi:hypothetical protein